MTQDRIVIQPISHSLRWWKNRIDTIDLSPSYQRKGRIWSSADKAFLIDSILNGFDVPKLYVADFTFGDSPLNERKHAYALIDGKQRLEAVMDFFSGTLALDQDFIYLADHTVKAGGLGYKDLQTAYPALAEKFDEHQLQVMGVVSKDSGLVNELFVRLNRSKPLTGAEKRNALRGPVPDVIRQIASHEFFQEYVKFDINRGEDLNTASKLLLFSYEGDTLSTKKADLDRFAENSSHSGLKLELAGRETLDVLSDMVDVFLPRDPLLRSSGQIPVFFWFIRDRSELELRFIRYFLLDFEKMRSTNRELAKQPETETDLSLDKELLDYDHLNRSTNDQASHKGRFEILTKRFKEFLRTALQIAGAGKQVATR